MEGYPLEEDDDEDIERETWPLTQWENPEDEVGMIYNLPILLLLLFVLSLTFDTL